MIRGGSAGAAIAMMLALLAGAPMSAAAASTAAAAPMRLVQYHGYEIKVPAAWPVYDLAADPTRCVLFNRHAVYLGTPGANQACPARAYGRTGAVLVQPSGPAGELPPATVQLPGNTAALPSGALPAAAATAATAGHVVHVAAPGPGVLVTATYGTDQSQVRTILAGARMTGRGATASSTVPRSSQKVSTTTNAAASTAKTAASAPQTAKPTELVDEPGHGLGFDPCTVPSVATMTAWLASPYRVIGTYLGGDNWACSYGNFSAEWALQVAAEGWKYIPIWVGPQAPCTTIRGAATINPAQAAAQGEAEAATAAATAQGFGYGPGTPIYFDMEGYNDANTACGQAVVTFIGGWTQGLHAAGYKSGVYSSAASGVKDLAAQYGNPAYTSPDDIWIADWTGDPVLTDPYVPATAWPHGQRLHQYYGGHNETWGGATVNIDNDVIGGDVAGLPAPAVGAPSMYGEPASVTVAPGRATTAALAFRGAGTAALVHWRASVPAGLTVRPASGVTVVPAHGERVVRLAVSAAKTTTAGRQVVTLTATAGLRPLTETFEMVSVAAPGATLPTSYPIVLYAADTASMAVAVAAARGLALPLSDVTGDFETAWADEENGSALVLSVGPAAGNALNNNPCGWTNPANEAAGHTPFFYPGEPLQAPLGADVFEPSGAATPDDTARLTAQLLQYALSGNLPDDGGAPIGPTPPVATCLGQPVVPVP
jgi:hypothetical protein